MDRSEIFLREVRQTLDRNILDWWLGMKDPRGGFYGEADFEGRPLPDAPRGVILNARIIWAFSAAGRQLGRGDCLVAARHAADWFYRHFCDHKYGGVYWSAAASGKVQENKKQLYAQAFAIYGLSELYRAGKDGEALKTAVNLFRTVERYFADRRHGGYTEALSRDFTPLEDRSLSEHDINADKTMNSHLHLLEAYTNLYRVWPDAALKEAVVSLLDIVCRRMTGSDGHLHLYFSSDWQVQPAAVSYGHDIETSWLALESALVLQDFDRAGEVRAIAARLAGAGNEGVMPDGSVRYERFPDGRYDDTRQWWVQAEAVVGNLWLWKYHKDDTAVPRALACWQYIRDHFIDPAGGEWHFNLFADGTPDRSLPKAGFWKCPYHNTRMCLEVLNIF
ncbi:MAG: AGE family epimerase/isomerase [Bacteroidales bacterium]|nr:AGE family epimerase/isomerase [Bacteroidales bacterium]